MSPQQLIFELCQRMGVMIESTHYYMHQADLIYEQMQSIGEWRMHLDNELMMVHTRLLAAVAMYSLRPKEK